MPDQQVLRDSYDFIIVGGGSAGSVLANRLSEIKDWNILLLEAGRSEIMPLNIPLMTPILPFTSYVNVYKSEPSKIACLGIKDNRCELPRGRVLGGCSSVNYMVYARGDARDYDGWAKMGNKGWSWKEVLPYFMKSEDLRINEEWVDPKFHGKDGYLTVDTPSFKTPLVKAFVDAGKELGYDVRDYNSGNVSAFSYVQSTMKSGSRMSTNKAFLHPIRYRKNLHVAKEAFVTKILIENKRAVGVEFMKRKKLFKVKAKREVILSAGAINSPQILMLSGIGPKEHLQSLGINVIKDLPVGYNLMDHPVIGYVIFTVDKSVALTDSALYDLNTYDKYFANRKGPLTCTGALDGIAFVDVFHPGNMTSFPNLEIQFISSSPLSFTLMNKVFNLKPEIANVYNSSKDIHSYMMYMTVTRPKSKGRISLMNTNPLSEPRIDIGYFKNPEDLEILVKAVNLAKRISKTKAFAKFKPKLFDKPIPPCAKYGRDTDAYWACHARHITLTNYHQCGTCKMGPASDPTAVVDPTLRVYGVKGLRVIDASIMPVITSANTNAPTIMIAEKGADIIKEDWMKI
ncbi:hypothetical protein O3M35_012076 [Rhynocoris fuscipes]|uniref:Glucose-methanol-choline oxidoreductase N-terminal domain-containing protein n=1 Tax=Rhynocoris fuscipes TaxID=488301 RepID=A0AAW1CV14_9HEMI